MSWVSGLAIYAIIWWLVLFMVLPIGVTTQDEAGGGIEPGTISSAPVKPRIWLKLAATSVVAGIVWLLGWLVVRAELFSLRDLAS
ncbi:MAG: DUF1467 family protein [Sphingomonadales bacterium]